MEIPEGWGGGGLNQKTFRGRGMDIFWNNTMMIIFITKENKNKDGLKTKTDIIRL